MLKKSKFYVGLTLVIQSISFVALFFMLYSKKKSLAKTFLSLAAVGGITGAYLICKQTQEEKNKKNKILSAMDACCDLDDEFNYFDDDDEEYMEMMDESSCNCDSCGKNEVDSTVSEEKENENLESDSTDIPCEEVVDENEFKE